MVRSAPLILTPDVQQNIAALHKTAEENKIDVQVLIDTYEEPGVAERHMLQMQKQTIEVPGPFLFTISYSVETGHPSGTCRHMSMCINRPERVPSPIAVWMVARLFGFQNGLEYCKLWNEHLSDNKVAINVVQPITN